MVVVVVRRVVVVVFLVVDFVVDFVVTSVVGSVVVVVDVTDVVLFAEVVTTSEPETDAAIAFSLNNASNVFLSMSPAPSILLTARNCSIALDIVEP